MWSLLQEAVTRGLKAQTDQEILRELYEDWHKEFQYIEDEKEYTMSTICHECGAEIIDGGQHYLCCSQREE